MSDRIEQITPAYRGVMIACTPGVVWWGRSHVTGGELLPLEGPLLLVGDHDSYWDPTADIFADAEFRRDVLGFRFTGWTGLPHDPDRVIFAQCTTNEQAHDLGLVLELSEHQGRINHVAYWLDQREDVLRGADVLLDYDVELEYGPGRHGMGEVEFLYFREPGGARIELNSGGYRNYEPDLETVRWTPQAGSNDWYRTTVFPDSMGECFPHPEVDAARVEQIVGVYNA